MAALNVAACRGLRRSLLCPRRWSPLLLPHTRFTSSITPSSTLAQRAAPYVQLSRLHAPIGSALLYLPCTWGLTLAASSAHVPPTTLAYYTLLFGTGALVMRGAGCTINDLWDRRIDRKVERTKDRPLASGKVGTWGAFSWLGLQLSVGLGVLVQLNPYSIVLGASSMALVVVYPLMKRITYWPQLVLGLAFNWGALLGSAALLGHVDWMVALPLYAGSVSWTLVYDTLYAHQDKVDDVYAGVKSTALLFAEQTKPILTVFSTAFLSLLTTAGWMNGCGLGFYTIAVAGAAIHLARNLIAVDLNSRTSCKRAFDLNATTGGIVWVGCLLDYISRVVMI